MVAILLNARVVIWLKFVVAANSTTGNGRNEHLAL